MRARQVRRLQEDGAHAIGDPIKAAEFRGRPVSAGIDRIGVCRFDDAPWHAEFGGHGLEPGFIPAGEKHSAPGGCDKASDFRADASTATEDEHTPHSRSEPVAYGLLEPGLGRHVAELVHGPGLDLPDSLLAHAHFHAQLTKRPRRPAVESEASHDDLSLPRLEITEESAEQLLEHIDLFGGAIFLASGSAARSFITSSVATNRFFNCRDLCEMRKKCRWIA